ncbi:MAG: SusC/RagA family TonB-linked outer membrane protein, partial [Bacteroidota bacterium]
MFGRASGLYAETAGLNDRGLPKRATVLTGGGIRLEGVQADGSDNTIYANANDFFGVWNFERNPTATYIFDASYIKLRDLRLRFALSKQHPDMFSLSLFGRNLAILYKNTPHFDPEQLLSAGNIQGFETGTYPTARTFGIRLDKIF